MFGKLVPGGLKANQRIVAFGFGQKNTAIGKTSTTCPLYPGADKTYYGRYIAYFMIYGSGERASLIGVSDSYGRTPDYTEQQFGSSNFETYNGELNANVQNWVTTTDETNSNRLGAVFEVSDRMTAERVEPGDVLLSVCGHEVDSIDDVLTEVLATPPGTRCALVISRAGERWQTAAVIGERAA